MPNPTNQATASVIRRIGPGVGDTTKIIDFVGETTNTYRVGDTTKLAIRSNKGGSWKIID